MKAQNTMMTDDKLEVRLRDNIKSHINRQFFEFKKNRKLDPASLKNRIRMLELGFV